MTETSPTLAGSSSIAARTASGCTAPHSPRSDEGRLRALVLDRVVDDVEDGVVLDTADDDARAKGVRRTCRTERAGDGEVVRLGASGGEDDLARTGAEGRGDALTRLLDDPAGVAAGPVEAGGVAGERELLDHRLPGSGSHRRGRRVVEVGGHRMKSTR
ncbi:hypothetical protein B277_11110 [Janibacter hoylei PVAS-1]|uniref:Uncharacterized protein n=1 Tax=Janibacter hoylei PVAS-1 TaxID=1210046 RepID=K1E5Z2_9MICO|nr:hypothetical protein B277_11110 [Janibacter hoylei PVAS-1]